MLKYFILNLFICAYSFISTKIIHTPIYENNQLIKLHNVILFQKNKYIIKNNYEDIFMIDFSADEDISNINIIKKILFGKNIKGKIRIFYFDKISKEDIIKELNNKNQKLCNKNIIKSYDNHIYNIINDWNLTYNLYNHNCIHFSNYFIKSLK
jgi:hypothetical protein